MNDCLQETFQDLADKSGKFVVEFNREAHYRPMVVALPKSHSTPETKKALSEMQLL
jgi:hypothetical protein